MTSSYYEKIGDEVCCADDEIPFEIPLSWEWIRLEDCCIKEIRRGKAPKYVDESGILVFAQKCNTKFNGIHTELALFLDERTLGKYSEDDFLQDGDVVINSTGTGTLGRVGFYRAEDNPHTLPIVPDSHVTVVRPAHAIEPFFLYAYIKTQQGKLENMGEGSTNQKELKPNAIKSLIVPIPPIEEQARIISMIHSSLAQLSEIEKSLT